jgi:formylglycine-generating enzyme required for sulfatase activity
VSAPAAIGLDSLFVETLGNGVILEVAPIPGGRFTMGVPAGEPDSESQFGFRVAMSAPIA